MRRPHRPVSGEFTFGMEVVLDIENCDLTVITDPDALKQYIAELVDRIKMVPFGPTWLQHFGHANPATSGYTAVQLIETSSIVVHVTEGPRGVHINVFSCRPFDPDDVMDFSEAFFGGTDTTYSVLSR